MSYLKGVHNATISTFRILSRLTGAKLELRAQNLPLQFNMSTVTGLGDLVEDEFLPTPLPMEVGYLFGSNLQVA